MVKSLQNLINFGNLQGGEKACINMFGIKYLKVITLLPEVGCSYSKPLE